MAGIKNGLEDGFDASKPKPEELVGKLNKKLAGVNKANLEKGKKLLDEIYGEQNKCKIRWQENLRDYRRAVLSTSNSGAEDAHGMSLKTTKQFLSNNKFLRRFREITDTIFEVGFMPEVWKIDNIHFLYKRKGERTDASNWRPITIAVSLGKHVERLFSILVSPMDDRNYENHAYVKRRSCMTAICEVQRHLLKAKTIAKENKKYKAVSVISADDIAGAFESVEAELIAYALKLVFGRDPSANLAGFIMSYFARQKKKLSASVVG